MKEMAVGMFGFIFFLFCILGLVFMSAMPCENIHILVNGPETCELEMRKWLKQKQK